MLTLAIPDNVYHTLYAVRSAITTTAELVVSVLKVLTNFDKKYHSRQDRDFRFFWPAVLVTN